MVVRPGHGISTWPISSRVYLSSQGHFAHRARVAGRNFAVSSKDVKNAVASPGHDQEDACLGARHRHCDLRLCQQSYRDARVVLQCADGELVVKTWVRSSSEYHRSSGYFQDVYRTAVDTWLQLVESLISWCETLYQEKLWTSPSPLLQTMWPKANFSKICKSSSMALSDSLQKISTAQHTGKQEHTVSMRGRGSWDRHATHLHGGVFDWTSRHEHQKMGELASS